jgi:hypothetical protein
MCQFVSLIRFYILDLVSKISKRVQYIREAQNKIQINQKKLKIKKMLKKKKYKQTKTLKRCKINNKKKI